uniref:fumarate reductase (NADH) n=1 Tax=Paramoeba aestuarina TaxID=180227 RepID=A0A7S4UZS1_9EUKA|mmetsp:Transcript_8571/g.12994  ORF Transcript_8571/g.12994 Transcript_8571/m.12994 type:complete len:495 (+) Transcript_8571:97-1581(+)
MANHINFLLVVAAFGAYYYIQQSLQPTQKTVIVVGGGLAGASAAIEAHSEGSRVIILEKEKDLGGNSAKASSGINGVGSVAQKEKGVEDDVKKFVGDVVESGHGLADEQLVQILAEQSASAIQFLTSHGVNLDVLAQLGGHSSPRTHRPSPPKDKPPVNVGFAIMRALKEYIADLPEEEATVIKHAHVTQLLTDDKNGKKRVKGVVYKNQEGNDVEVKGDAVILTTGGYSFNTKMLEKFAPHVAHLSTTNGDFALGEGIDLAAPLSPSLRLMDQVQVHPTCFVDVNDLNSRRRFLAPEALRGSGGILLNHKGERFANELGLRDYVTKQIFQQQQEEEGPATAFLLLSEEAVEIFQRPNLKFYKFKKLVREFEGGVREFAEEFNLPVERVIESIVKYQKQKEEGQDEFGKKTFPASFNVDSPVHAMVITPCIHYTMGGLQISKNGEVLDSSLEPIKGLFAAGEVTGGVHGANRLAGNSLLECTVFGRLAGENASK